MKRIISILAALALAGVGLAAPAQAAVIDWDLAPAKVSKNPPPVDTKIKGAAKTSALLAGTPYFYAGGVQSSMDTLSPVVTSVSSTLTNFVNDPPYLDTTNDAHTLVEMAVRKSNNNNNEVIEAGITRDPTVYADSQPRLFVGYWNNGTFGGYNAGFTLQPTRPVSPGDVMPSANPITLNWSYQTTGGVPRWWLYYTSGTTAGYIGYFTVSTTWPGKTFDKVGQYLGFGEVAQHAGGTRTFSCSDMGNKTALPSATPGAMSFGTTSFNSSGTNVNITALAASPGYSSYHHTVRSYRVGGAGLDSTGTGAGTLGSC